MRVPSHPGHQQERSRVGLEKTCGRLAEIFRRIGKGIALRYHPTSVAACSWLEWRVRAKPGSGICNFYSGSLTLPHRLERLSRKEVGYGFPFAH